MNFGALSYSSYLEGEFSQVFLHFAARIWCILSSNFTILSCVLQPEYPWLEFHQVFLHFTAGLWTILGSNSTRFSCILQLDSGVSLAQIPPGFLEFYSQTLEYPWLKFHQVFLHFTARLWSILDSNSTKFSCILQLDSGVSLAQIPPGFLAFYSWTLEYPWLKFHQVFLHFTARLWSILGSNSTRFSCILQPDTGVSLAQINQVFLHFTARLWCFLSSTVHPINRHSSRQLGQF